jgi:hypothetical protein
MKMFHHQDTVIRFDKTIFVTNEEGDDVLLGLTVSETKFVLLYERTENYPDDAMELLGRYLRNKHLAARLLRLRSN